MTGSVRRLLALLTVLALMISAIPLTASATAAENAPLLAYVPLDDRPVTVDRVQYAAAAAGFDVRLPDEALYRTRLDGQGLNPNGTQHGDGKAIMTWLEGMEASGCDLYVLHLDQLLSGGLVGSRDPDNTSGGANAEECDILSRLAAITDKTDANGNYENRVYFVDTVMRLASTGGYKGLGGSAYDAFREYAAKERPSLSIRPEDVDDWDGAVGVMDTIYSQYGIDPNGNAIPYSEALNSTMVQTYHNARRRKLDLLHWLRLNVQNNETTVFVFGVDDASPKPTIQTNELKYIAALLDRYEIYISADTDSSGLMALARCACDVYGVKPTVRVRYFGAMADAAADEYDIGTLRSNVRTHVESLGATYVDETNAGAAADLELLVLTRISDSFTVKNNGASSMYESHLRALIDKAKANIAADVPTVIVDASTGDNYYASFVKGLPNLQDMLLTEVEIPKLLGYSNWNTVGNSLGIALGTGMARYAYLVGTSGATDSSNVGFVKAMTYGCIKDITYNARNKATDYTSQFLYWIRYTAGGSGWTDSNFYPQMTAYSYDTKEDWELCGGEHYVNNELEWCLMSGCDSAAYNGCGQQVLNALMAGSYYTKLGDAVKTAPVDTVTLDNFRFPWYRVFEIRFDIFVTETLMPSFDEAAPLKQSGEAFAQWLKAKLGAEEIVIKAPQEEAYRYVGTGFKAVATVGGRTVPYTVIVPADVTGDGQSNTVDVRAVLQYVLGKTLLSSVAQRAADVDGDAEVSSTDARIILKSSLSK
ncbi:MAG: DUF4127 family protein [Clostridia bacterium]|nr:DUF4127 family protein [Clostridia bacterium]